MRRHAVVSFLTLHLMAAPWVVAAQAQKPQEVVAAFCRHDAFGARTTPASLAAIGGLVDWPLEPAWDRVVLISAYEIGSATHLAPDTVEIEVGYSVVGTLGARQREVEPQPSRRVFRLVERDDGWRILGPPLPPHVFIHRIDVDAMRYALGGRGGYLSQSRFVAELMRAAGWRVPRESVQEIAAGRTYGRVARPQVGDLVLYLDDGVPYHVGVLEAEGVVVSATLGAGLVRSTQDAFRGRVRYLRLVERDRAGARLDDEPAGNGEQPRRRETDD